MSSAGPNPSAHVCTPTQEQAAETFRLLKNLRNRLERWELQHLRAHAAELSDRLDQAHQRISALEAETYRAWEAADGWREDAMNLARDLEDDGKQVGITQGGALVGVQTAVEESLEQQLARLVEPGEVQTLADLMARLDLPNSAHAENALRSVLVGSGYTQVREQYGFRRRLWKAPVGNKGGAA